MKRVILLAIGLLPLILSAQNSPLQDKSGETSFLLNNMNAISFNSGNSSVTTSYSYKKPTWFIGTNLKIRSTEGVAKIMDGYKFKPEVELGFYYGKILKTSVESAYHSLFYGAKFNNLSFYLLNEDGSNKFMNKIFYGGSLYIGYNRTSAVKMLAKNGESSPYLIGITLNYGIYNNINDLKSVQTYSTYTSEIGNTQTTLLSDKKSGYSGSYTRYGALRMNMDLYLFPRAIGGRIGIGGYLRSQVAGYIPRTNAGAGILIGRKGAPGAVVFGILYQFNDIFNQRNSQSNIIGRGGINIVTGYNF
jgi:hypothetical protein